MPYAYETSEYPPLGSLPRCDPDFEAVCQISFYLTRMYNYRYGLACGKRKPIVNYIVLPVPQSHDTTPGSSRGHALSA